MGRNRNGGQEWAILARFVPRGLAARIAVLALVGSLTEGFGLLMLVPIVESASGASAPSGTRWAGLIPAEMSLAQLLAVFVGVAVLRALVVQWRLLAEAELRLAVGQRVRHDVFGSLLAAEWRYLSRFTGGELLARSVQLVERVSDGCQQLLGLIAICATLAVLFFTALLLAPLPTLVLGAAGAAVLAIYARFRRRAAAEGEELGRAYQGLLEFFVQRLGALRLIKAYGNELREMAAGDVAGQRVVDARLSFQRGASLGQFLLQSGSALAIALAAWLALQVWQVPLARLLPLIALCARSLPLLDGLQSAWHHWAHQRPALIELRQILDEARNAVEAGEAGERAMLLRRELAFENVTVHWKNRAAPAIDEVSFTVAAGTTLAIVGPSGSGKSTVADLAGGLLLPDRGGVTIDGSSLAKGALKGWRRRVAYVQQEPLLFSGTVRDNLLWAVPEASEAKLHEALTHAAAAFVLALPQGLDTRVGDGGRELSGGERQRIALARALLLEPDLLILDEPTSALDADNEQVIVEALGRLKGRMTILLICHRGALLSLADRVIEMRDGRIVRESAA